MSTRCFVLFLHGLCGTASGMCMLCFLCGLPVAHSQDLMQCVDGYGDFIKVNGEYWIRPDDITGMPKDYIDLQGYSFKKIVSEDDDDKYAECASECQGGCEVFVVSYGKYCMVRDEDGWSSDSSGSGENGAGNPDERSQVWFKCNYKCFEGYTGPDEGPCIPCEIGTYKDRKGSAVCDTCPSNSISPEGSTDATDCGCNAGYSGTSDGLCALCEAGKHKSYVGRGSCPQCQSHSSSTEIGLVGPCACNAGYYVPSNNPNICSVCSGDSWSVYAHVGECYPACQAETGLNDAGECEDCPPGTISIMNASLPQVEMFKFYKMESRLCRFEIGSSSVKLFTLGNYLPEMQCFWIFSSPDQIQVRFTELDVAFHDYVLIYECSTATCGLSNINPNERKQIHKVQTHTTTTFTIDAGYGLIRFSGKYPQYNEDGHASSIIHMGMTAVVSSYRPGRYVCNGQCPAGKFNDKSGSDNCEDCAGGKYSDLDGMSTCTNCPVNLYTPPGNIGPCTCNAGFVRKEDGTCDMCIGGQYSANGNDFLPALVSTSGECQTTQHELAFTEISEDTHGHADEIAHIGCAWIFRGWPEISVDVVTLDSDIQPDLNSIIINSCKTPSCAPDSTDLISNVMRTDTPFVTAISDSGFVQIIFYTIRSTRRVIRVRVKTTPESRCEACGTGKYSVFEGSLPLIQCSDCDAGKYSYTTGRTECDLCESNSDSGRGQDLCACNAGYSKLAQNPPPTCTACQSDSLSTSGHTGPCPCNAGYYAVTEGAATCTQCRSGSWSTAGHTGPCACNAGYYSVTEGAATCTPCQSNSHSAVTGLNGPCTCNAGYYSVTEGAATCTQCQNNSHSAVTGLDGPCPCNAGYYSVTEGAATCTQCRYGSSSTQGRIGPCLCKAGYYKDAGNCVECATGKYSEDVDAPTCSECGAGTYLDTPGNDEASDCDDCGCGKYSSATAAISIDTCQECVAGTYAPRTGSSACEPCAMGKYYTLDGMCEDSCVSCGAGKYLEATGSDNETDCVLCGKGTYSPGTGSSSSRTCLNCRPGTYGNTARTDCVLCGMGTYSPVTGSSSSTTCLNCPAGTWLDRYGLDDSSDCYPCSKGKYSSSTGATFEGTCQDCIAGKYLSTRGNDAEDNCVQCIKGKYSSSTGATKVATCLDCVAGTYLETTGNDESSDCIKCAAGSFSGGIGASSCLDCVAGEYTETEGSIKCAICGKGTYSGDTGNSFCSQCGPGKYSTQQAQTSSATCVLCAEGKYSTATAATADTTCDLCPTDSVSAVGSDTASDCVCHAGFSGQDGGTCTMCASGTYSVAASNPQCEYCDNNADSPAASTVQSACKCNAGFHGLNGGTCSECVAGKFNTLAGSHTCTDCKIGTYSATVGATQVSTCLACPTNSTSLLGSNVSTDCVCSAGFTGPDSETCSPCVAGKYKRLTGSEACTDCKPGWYSTTVGAIRISTCLFCPERSYSLSGSSTPLACICIAGNTGPDGGRCHACGVGKYKANVGTADCDICPVFSDSYSGSRNKQACRCNSGYSTSHIMHNMSCTICPGGKYKLADPKERKNLLSTQCEPCGLGGFSIAGSSSCTCNKGFFSGPTDICTMCAAGKYTATRGEAECTICPTHSHSPAGSTAITACTCNAGASGPDAQSCEQCETGQYQSTTASIRCDVCTENSNSPAASTAATACICNAGFYGPDGGICTPCAAGKYKVASGSAAAACVECMHKYSSPPGSNTRADCICEVGTVINGEACPSCMSGKYKKLEECESCPENSESFFGSNKLTDCRCTPGFVRGPRHLPTSQLLFCSSSDDEAPSCEVTFSGLQKAMSGLEMILYLTIDVMNSDFAEDDEYISSVTAGAYSMGSNFMVTGGLDNQCDIKTTILDFVPIDRSAITSAGKLTVAVTTTTAVGGYDCFGGTLRANVYIDEVFKFCIPCTQGKYSDIVGGITCHTCPSNSNSLLGYANCVCEPGYWRSETGTCTGCVAGKYKDVVGDTCSTCVMGKYPDALSTVCINCVAGTYSTVGICVKCPNNTDSSAGSVCTCNAGYTFFQEDNMTSCEVCPVGTEKLMQGNQPCGCSAGWEVAGHLVKRITSISGCYACQEGSYKTIPGPTLCKRCIPGKYSTTRGAATNDCVACAANSYSTFNHDDCWPCPNNSVSNAGSFMPRSCSCNRGYEKLAAGPYIDPKPHLSDWYDDAISGRYQINCSVCPAGKYTHPYKYLRTCWLCWNGKYSTTIGADSDRTCNHCPADTYATSTRDTCLACPANRSSPATSNSIASCKCNAGWTAGTNTDECTACVAGKYKTATADIVCDSCAAGKYSIVVGATFDTCENCSAGTYNDAAYTSCVDCPANHGSPVGSGSIASCECSAGWTAETSTDECTKCVAGKYKTATADVACDSCAAGKYSTVVGAPSNTCEMCAANTYNDAAGYASCVDCPANHGSPVGSGSIASCECNAGWTAETSTDECTACVAGKYKTATADVTCDSCTAGKYSTVVGAHAYPCKNCSADTYNDAAGYASCVDCPANSASPVGSDSITYCECNAGWTAGTSTDECTACVAGKYKTSIADVVCTLCVLGKHSTYIGSPADLCTGCEVGSYAAVDRGSCVSCPQGSSAAAGSPALDACTCNSGWAVVPGSDDSCVRCAAGKYKVQTGDASCDSCVLGTQSTTVGSQADVCEKCALGAYAAHDRGSCVSCLMGSSAPAGSHTPDACTCNAGWVVVPDSRACAECVSGTYETAGSDVCQECPGGSSSPAGSVGITSCVCGAGYSGPDGGLCAACAANEYKATTLSYDTNYARACGPDGNEACVTEQSSTNFGGVSLRANDGNTAQVWGSQSCTHTTGSGSQQWWRVDLVEQVAVDSLTLFGRSDCCATRTQTFSIFIGNNISTASGHTNEVCVANQPHLSAGGSTGVTCTQPITGRYVFFVTTLNKALTLCEVQVRSRACSACHANSNSPVGSTAATACVCNVGFAGAAGGPCLQCGSGKYSSSNASACVDCAAGTYKATKGASTANTCQDCAAGKYSATTGASVASTCQDCGAGKYQTTTGASAETMCVPCPVNSNSSAGSSVSAGCICGAGYSGPDGGLCAACAVNEYKATALSYDTNYARACGPDGNEACLTEQHSMQLGGRSSLAVDANTDQRYSGGSCTHTHTGGTQWWKVDLEKQVTVSGLDIFGRVDFCCPQVDVCCPARTEGFSIYVGDDSTSFAANALCVTNQPHLLQFGVTKISCTRRVTGRYVFFVITSGEALTLCEVRVWSRACSLCRAGSKTDNIAVANCECNAGFSGPDGETCTTCAAGKYKPTTGTGLCTDCETAKYSVRIGAISRKYCFACMENAHAVAGSSSIAACICNAGYAATASQSGTCEKCWPGKYRMSGSDSCTKCAANSYTNSNQSGCVLCPANTACEEGSSAAIACVCSPGFSDVSGNCTKCAAGKHKRRRGNFACSSCSHGKYSTVVGASVDECHACPANTDVSDAGDACICRSGSTGPDGGPCLQCATGKYKTNRGSVGSDQSCTGTGVMYGSSMGGDFAGTAYTHTREDALLVFVVFASPHYNMTAVSFANAQSSTAPANTSARYITTGTPTLTLDADTVSDMWDGTTNYTTNTYFGYDLKDVNVDCCDSCPADADSPAGSAAPKACACNAGFTEINGTTCAPCPAGTYSTAGGPHACTACVAGKYKAVAGAGTCRNCRAGTYSSAVAATANATCGPCPANSDAPAASAMATACACNQGFAGTDGGPCVECLAGKTSDHRHTVCFIDCPRGETYHWENDDCVPCPANTSKLSSGPHACTPCPVGMTVAVGGYGCSCRAGYTQAGSDPPSCSLCPTSTYRPARSNDTCDRCPHNLFSVAGSTSTTACHCKAGYSPVQGRCVQCSARQYKAEIGEGMCQDCLIPNSESTLSGGVACECSPGYFTLSGSDALCTSPWQGPLLPEPTPVSYTDILEWLF